MPQIIACGVVAAVMYHPRHIIPFNSICSVVAVDGRSTATTEQMLLLWKIETTRSVTVASSASETHSKM
jgi:hypothetical protein